MNPHFSFFGLTFYWYGLIIGLAIALVLVLVDFRAARFDRSHARQFATTNATSSLSLQLFFQQWSMVLLVGGFMGARLWHVATDWQRYQGQWGEVLSLAHGGLSILGAVIGGLITLGILHRYIKSVRVLPLLLITDAIVFGLPFGQAVGRFGNFINQELYGLPSTLPWAITIDPGHRLPGFELVTTYHPLFLYEAMLMIGLGLSIWIIDRKKTNLFGAGFFTLYYITAYTTLRFGLDFLRLDRPVWLFGMGTNQIVLAVLFVGLVLLWVTAIRREKFTTTKETSRRK